MTELPAYREERPSRPAPAAAKSLSAFLAAQTAAPPKSRRRSGPPRARESAIEAAREKSEAMAKSGDWAGATAVHLVALYAFLHREVYEVEPLELDAKSWWLAERSAAGLLAKYFEGDVAMAVSFMRWVWGREIEREKWRRENGRDGQRIGWRLQFSASLVTDYRTSGRRTGK
jgi:hypothetical protein